MINCFKGLSVDAKSHNKLKLKDRIVIEYLQKKLIYHMQTTITCTLHKLLVYLLLPYLVFKASDYIETSVLQHKSLNLTSANFLQWQHCTSCYTTDYK
jgi:hypothetical protein